MDDELPDPLANFDQILKTGQDITKLVWGYYTSLLQQGFSAEQAMTLTIDYQHILFTRG